MHAQFITHACLLCVNARGFSQPERLLSDDTISFEFTCDGGALNGAYGNENAPHTMTFWLAAGTVNVDGGQSIEAAGCEHYVYRPVSVKDLTKDSVASL